VDYNLDAMEVRFPLLLPAAAAALLDGWCGCCWPARCRCCVALRLMSVSLAAEPQYSLRSAGCCLRLLAGGDHRRGGEQQRGGELL
jgi:hypothetical protein